MSDEPKLYSISTLAGSFEDEMKLQEYCNQQFTTILKLKTENIELRTQISQLSEMLAANTHLLKSPNEKVEIKISPEKAICEIQIQKLEQVARDRCLTLEETKRLEILIKSLYLIREAGSGATTSDMMSLPADISLASLEQMATSKSPDTE